MLARFHSNIHYIKSDKPAGNKMFGELAFERGSLRHSEHSAASIIILGELEETNVNIKSKVRSGILSSHFDTALSFRIYSSLVVRGSARPCGTRGGYKDGVSQQVGQPAQGFAQGGSRHGASSWPAFTLT